MKQGTQSQCCGTTQRDGVGREVGGGVQDGETQVYPWLIHVNVWQKNTTEHSVWLVNCPQMLSFAPVSLPHDVLDW